jgi:uncharacterized membrane protein
MPGSRVPAPMVVAAIALAVAGTVALIGGETAPRTLLALPLIFFLPGHAILAAVLPGEPKGLLRFVFAVGLSLAIVIMGGLVLNVVAALTALNWLSLLCIIVATGYLIAFARRTPLELRSIWPLPVTWTLSPRDAVLYSGAAVAVLLAFAISTGESRKLHLQTDFTEFWITPDRTAELGTVTVGMKNVEHRPMSYDIELMLDDQMIGAWRNIALRESETWSKTIDLPGPSRRQRLEAWLFKSGDHQKVYRRVWLASREPA